MTHGNADERWTIRNQLSFDLERLGARQQRNRTFPEGGVAAQRRKTKEINYPNERANELPKEERNGLLLLCLSDIMTISL